MEGSADAGGDAAAGDFHTFAKVNTSDNAFLAGHEYEIVSLGDSDGETATSGSDAEAIMEAVTGITGGDDLGGDTDLQSMLMQRLKS